MALIFQYGSNLSTDRSNGTNRLCGDAKFFGTVITESVFELTFDIKTQKGHAAADIVEGIGRNIYGVVYQIPDYLIRRETAGSRKSMDKIEGKGRNYKRIPIRLKLLNGNRIGSPPKKTVSFGEGCWGRGDSPSPP